MSKKRSVKRKRLRSRTKRRIKEPFYKGSSTEDPLVQEQFYDWLNRIVHESHRRRAFVAEDYEKMFRMAQQGMIHEEMGHILGFAQSRFGDALRNDEKARWAIVAGQAWTKEFVTGRLMDKIRAGNLAAIIFYLKTRAGWTEKYILETQRSWGDLLSKSPEETEELLKHVSDAELDKLTEIFASAVERGKESGALIDGTAKRLEDGDSDTE